MDTITVPARVHRLETYESPAKMAQWAERAARSIDPSLPPRTIGALGQVARVLVDNALQHGAPPVTVEVAVSTFVTLAVTDHGTGTPEAHPDGTGSLAVIVGELASLWDITEHDDGSKTVTAMIPILEESPRRGKRCR